MASPGDDSYAAPALDQALSYIQTLLREQLQSSSEAKDLDSQRRNSDEQQHRTCIQQYDDLQAQASNIQTALAAFRQSRDDLIHTQQTANGKDF
jgi:hypothetical protein